MRAAALVLVTALGLAAARSLELRADQVVLRAGGTIMEATGHVRITDGRSRISAARAVYAVRDRRLTLAGGVTITTPDADLDADAATVLLTAANQIDSVEASGKVVLEAEGRVVRAARLSYHAGSGAVTASGGVEVFVPPDLIASGQTLVMRSREAATLEGRARVQTKDGYLEGDRIEFSDRTQIAYARGNVVGVFEDTRITAPAATFYGRESRAVFRDGVTVTRPGRTMRAEVVTVFYRDRRIVAEGQTTIHLEDEPKQP